MFKSLELQLIAQVRKHKDLYDKNCRDFEVKERHWQQVADVIGISALTAKLRWTSLKSRYLRLRKHPNPSNEWAFYNYLQFLDPVCSPENKTKVKDVTQEQKSEILFEPRLVEIPRLIRKNFKGYKPPLQEFPKHYKKVIISSEPRLEEIPQGIRKTYRSSKPSLQKIPKHIQKIITSSEPRLEPNRSRSYKPRFQNIPKHNQNIITSPEPRLEETPQRIQRTYRSCKPRLQEITSSESVIINENNDEFTSQDEICDYELKLSNEDNCTYELKINNDDICRNGSDNNQNRVYKLDKFNSGRRVYGNHNMDDCELFAQFVAAKMRTLQTDAERNAMKHRILQAIDYSPEQAEDAILDIVFIEGDENED